jgi:signal transduction histidine kinase
MGSTECPATVATAADAIRAGAHRLGLSLRERREIVHLASTTDDTAALASLLADSLTDKSLQHRWEREAIVGFLDDVATVSGLERDSLALHVHAFAARNPSLLALSPQLGIETEIRILYALAPIDGVSLWSGPAGELSCRAYAGDGDPSRKARLAAEELLERRPPTGGRLSALPVLRWQLPEAALVVRPAEHANDEAVIAATRTTAALAPILEREALLVRNAARERALAASGERLLTRVGFDLHDGPIQDVAALADDVRVFGNRLEEVAEAPSPEVLRGFLADLHARIEELDRGLRGTVHSLQSPAAARGNLGEALRREVDSFARQSDVQIELSMRGGFDSLSTSQRIALVRIAQESLANARDHGGARSASITLVETPEGLDLQIRDDGRGFDVPRTLVRAARRGRFGLVGMSERARLLGGRFDVQSQPGGPTVVSVNLPRWQPTPVAVEQPAALV